MKKTFSFILAVLLVVTMNSGFFSLPTAAVYAEAGSTDSIVIPYPLFNTDENAVDPNVKSAYSVTVNGQTVPVHKFENYSYIQFAFAGQANIAVTVNEPVNTCKLSPERYGITPEISGNTVSFSLNEPRKIILHQVNGLSENLIIFAEPQEENPPKSGTSSVVNIQSYGVDKTGSTDTSAVINSVIQSLPNNATLYFPAGSYMIDNAIRFKSNMTLYLAPGAEIVQNKRFGIKSDMIDIIDCSNVAIRGRGRINGNGLYNRALKPETFGWYAAIFIRNSRNVTVEDVTNFNPGGAGLWAEASDTLNYYNWKVISDMAIANTDGQDFWSCRNATVDNVFVKTTDDFGNNATDPNNLIQEDYNITYTNFVDYNAGEGGGIAFGTHICDYDVHDIKFENGDMIRVPQFFRALAYAGGTLRNIFVNNITVEEIAPGINTTDGSAPFILKTGPSFDSDWNGHIGKVDGVHFNNINILQNNGNQRNFLVSYDSTTPVKNISFNSVVIEGKPLTELKPYDPTGENDKLQNQWQFQSDSSDLSMNPNNDLSTVTFTADPVTRVNVTATQPSASKAGLVGGKLTFTRSGGDNSADLTVNYKVRGNAVSGKDYQPLSGQVTIPAGEASVDVDVTPIAGNYKDGIDQVLVLLKTGEGYMIDKDFLATVNIADTSTPPPPPLQEQSIVNDDFNLLPDGSDLNGQNGWTSASDTGASSIIAGRADAADKALCISDANETGNLMLDKYLSAPVSGQFSVEFKVMFPTANDCRWDLFLNDSSDKPIYHLRPDNFGTGGVYINYERTPGNEHNLYLNGADFVASPGTWYTLRFDMDTAAKTYDVYIDGTLSDQQSFLDTTAADFKNLKIKTSSSGKSTFYLDDLKVTQSSADVLDDSFDSYGPGALGDFSTTRWAFTGDGNTTATVVSLDKALNMTGSTSGNTEASKTFAPVTAGKLTLQYSFMLPTLTDLRHAEVYLKDSSGKTVIHIWPYDFGLGGGEYLCYEDSSGNVHNFYMNSTDLALFASTWYRIKVAADLDAKTYDVFVNDTNVASGKGFVDVGADGVSMLDIRTHYGTAGTTYFDNINITAGVASPPPPAPHEGDYLNDGFDTGETPGQAPVNWVIDEGDAYNTATVDSTYPGSGDNSLKVFKAANPGSDSTASRIYLHRDMDVASGKISMFLKFMAPENAGKLIQIGLSDTSSGAAAFKLITDMSGPTPYLGYAVNGGTKSLIDNLVPGNWYKLRLDMDTNAHTCDVYVNGKPVQQGLLFYDGLNDSSAMVEKVDRVWIKTSRSAAAEYYLNDIIVTPTVASSDVGLSTLAVNGVQLVPDADTGNYSYAVGYNISSVDITAVTSNDSASLIINSQAPDSNGKVTVNLVPGGNTIIPVTVTAQNGTVSSRSLTITRISGGANSFQVGTPVFTNDAGITITKLVGNGSVNVSVNITNKDVVMLPATLVAALYDGNGMIKTYFYNTGMIESNKTVVLNGGFKLPSDVKGYKVKVFVWDSMAGMKPLSNVVSMTE